MHAAQLMLASWDFPDVTERVGQVFEGIGVAIIALGGVYALGMAVLARLAGRSSLEEARAHFGRPLLLGLEVLVAADIIETVTVDRTLESVVSLGALVLVRVVLSFALEVELDGVPPWRRAEEERKEAARAPDG